jgi:hypothetical protein
MRNLHCQVGLKRRGLCKGPKDLGDGSSKNSIGLLEAAQYDGRDETEK